MDNALAVTAPTEQSTSTASLVLNVELMDRMMRFADMMSSGRATVPKHLQGNSADCLAVVMQATQWGMNPFAVAQKTHLVNGTLGYEAQLVNAVLQTTGAIDGDFAYEYKGEDSTLECRVGAVPKGSNEILWGQWLHIKLVTVKNSPLWKSNPRQQMGYLQVKNWARAFKPAAILGVYTVNELIDSAPRDMGPVDQMPDTPVELAKLAKDAAAKGVAAYQEFWSTRTKEERHQLKGDHDANKMTAQAADNARTVDLGTGEIKEPATSTNTSKSFDEVMAMLCAAKNLDQVYVAGDWILTVDDADQQEILNGKFAELVAKFGGAA
jgi:hypothetical protein